VFICKNVAIKDQMTKGNLILKEARRSIWIKLFTVLMS